MSDDFSADVSTVGTVAVNGGPVRGVIEADGDFDWVRVVLTAGISYTIDIRGFSGGGGSLLDPVLHSIYGAAGNLITKTYRDDGGIAYDPRLVFVPTSSGTYFISVRSYAQRGTGDYTVEVTAPNTAPVASSLTVTVNEDALLTGSLPAASDADADPVTYAKATDPSHGTVGVTVTGSFTYTPIANFSGMDAFNYTVSDGRGGVSSYMVSVVVNPVNDSPSGNVSISGGTTQGQMLTLAHSLDDIDGIPTSGAGAVAYQWRANGTAISGATNVSYTLTAAEVGKVITVTAAYTDLAGTVESVTSAPTAPVEAPSLQGMVYHWKSHMLLTGVNVWLNSAAAVQANAGELFDLRAARFDAASGTLSVEVWANALTGNAVTAFGNFDFLAQTPGATAASFVSALSADWSVVASASDPHHVLVSGISLSELSGSVKLGTLQLTLPAQSTAVQVSFSQIEVGTLTGVAQGLSMKAATTGTEGSYSFTNLSAGALQISASRAATDSGSAITSADALAALRIAVGLNPNPDPDGTGPKTAPAISPYQLMAADVNGSGAVTSADALAILRMAVKLSTALPQEWMFVEEKRDFWDEVNQKFTLTRTNAAWDRTITADPSQGPVNLVGILKGDVNGSWAAPAGSTDLDNVDPTYFQRLALLMGQPNQDQWGGGP